MKSKIVMISLAVILALGGSGAEAGKTKRGRTDEPTTSAGLLKKKKRIPAADKSSVHPSKTAVSYDSDDMEETAIALNTKTVMGKLAAVNWSELEWADIAIYQYFDKYISVDKYLELVKANNFSVISSLSTFLMENKKVKFPDSGKANHFVLMALGGVNSRSRITKNMKGKKVISTVAQLLNNNELVPDQWPERGRSGLHENEEYYTLFKNMKRLSNFKQAAFHCMLANPLGIAFDYMNLKSGEDDEDDWDPAFTEAEESGEVKLEQFLNYFDEDDQGQVMFYLFTGKEKRVVNDEGDEFEPETELQEKLLEFINHSWSLLGGSMKTNLSYFCLEHLKRNPLKPVSSVPPAPPVSVVLPPPYAGLSKPGPSGSDKAERARKLIQEKYSVQFLRALPMDCTMFMAQLWSKNGLSDEQKAVIDSRSTRADKVSYYLNSVLMPSLECDDIGLLESLISTIKDSDYFFLKRIANNIEQTLHGWPADKQVKETFRKNYDKIVKKMDLVNTDLLTILYSKNLLPGNTKAYIDAKLTPSEKNQHFLDRVIIPSDSCYKPFMDALYEDGSPSHMELHRLLSNSLFGSSK